MENNDNFMFYLIYFYATSERFLKCLNFQNTQSIFLTEKKNIQPADIVLCLKYIVSSRVFLGEKLLFIWSLNKIVWTIVQMASYKEALLTVFNDTNIFFLVI